MEIRAEWMVQGKKISELEEKTIEINHLKIRQKVSRKKPLKDLYDNNKNLTFMSLEFWKEMRVYVIGILEGAEKEDGAEKELEEVMYRNILELGKRHKHKESRSYAYSRGKIFLKIILRHNTDKFLTTEAKKKF